MFSLPRVKLNPIFEFGLLDFVLSNLKHTRGWIHPDHLESALRNLIENAIRHGEGHAVRLEAFRKRDRVAIRVRDRGRGISPANHKRIFERFFTTERDRGGSGLGLAIAKAVAETRGGHLEYETGPAGTCFELLL